MVDELGPDTNEKMRALCKKISVAHDLDEEIQEELYSHIEDKLLAYLNGEEAVTEEDAFILVREHFGDPSALKGLLQNVHAVEANISLARRLAAAIIVTSGVTVAHYCLTAAAFGLLSILRAAGNYFTVLVIQTLLPVTLTWLLLRYWQRRVSTGHEPWFLKWRPEFLTGTVAILFLLQSLTSPLLLYTNLDTIPSPMTERLILPITVLSPLLRCMVWFWWCDRPPRRIRAVISTAAVWVVWSWSVSLIPSIEALASARAGVHGIEAMGMTLMINAVFVPLLFIHLTFAFVACVTYALARRAATGFTWMRAKI